MNRRDGGRRFAPSSLGDVLAESRKFALERSHAPMDRYTYRLAVGRRIADRTELGQLRRGELTVYVASSAWAQELSLLAPQMLERLRDRGLTVERLRFRLRAGGPSGGLPRPRASVESPPPLRKHLPPELDARLAKLDDEELRLAISEAAGLALGRAERSRLPERKPPTSSQPAARDPRAAEPRSAPLGPKSRPVRAGSPGTRAKPRG